MLYVRVQESAQSERREGANAASRKSDGPACVSSANTRASSYPPRRGAIVGPGVPTVVIGKLPAAVVGDHCACVGPPDVIVKGSATVLIGKKPAVRMGDVTAHGGNVVLGCPTVMIGG